MRRHEGYAALIVAVLILILAMYVGWRSLEPSQNNKLAAQAVVDWQSYRNTRFGFELRYPAESVTPPEELVSTGPASPTSDSFQLCAHGADAAACLNFLIYEPQKYETQDLQTFVSSAVSGGNGLELINLEGVPALKTGITNGGVTIGGIRTPVEGGEEVFLKRPGYYLWADLRGSDPVSRSVLQLVLGSIKFN